MNSNLPRRKSLTAIAELPSAAQQPRREPKNSSRERFNQTWDELRTDNAARTSASDLSRLIEQDAPLRNHNGLVLMYGPFQTEMQPANGQGVASWLRDCVHKHGLPSLVRYDDRRRAQVFRRDQFQPWLEPLVAKVPG